jgi:transposase
VISCYEAGRDGHWLHRALSDRGIDNLEVGSNSIKVSQQGKHVKTDRLDVRALLNQPYHYCHGETDALIVVHVPSREDEDDMRVNRELSTLKKERTQHSNRMGSALARYGMELAALSGRDWAGKIASLCDRTGERLPAHTQGELVREHDGRIRALAIETAWLWVSLQPQSKRSLWFKARYADAGKRQRKIGIVAVARCLLGDLWRYLNI